MWRGTAKRILIAAVAVVCAPSPAAVRAAPPPQRGWELVSPADKGGKDVIADSSRTHAQSSAAVGLPSAVAFASLGGFADAIGGGISTEYLAERTGQPDTSGWSTHAITPPQQPMSVTAIANQLDPLYEAFSPDLAKAVFRAWSPLTDAPNVADVENLYVREDLRTPGAGAYRLLTSAPAPLAPIERGNQRPFLAAATPDMAHVLLESRLALAADATAGNPTLFASDGGVPRLLAPAGGCPSLATAQPCSAAGLGAIGLHQSAAALSADGSRTILTAPVTGSGNVATGAPTPSRLYQLDDRGTAATDDDALVQLNASEAAVPEQPRAASFQAASADGDRVWFTSAERLTDDAPVGGGLYLWERQPASASQQLTVDATGGTFTLHAPLPALAAGGPVTTDPLPFDASAAQVQAALEALANVGAGNVTVSGAAGGPWAIAFGGALAGVDVPPLAADGGGLSGGAASATVSATHAVRNLTAIAPGGSSTVTLGASRDGRRVYFATAGQLLPGGPAVAEDGIYLWQEDAGGAGELSFVAAVSLVDARANADTAAWNLKPITSRVTPDGGALLFTVSDESGVGAGHDHGACEQNPNKSSTGICAELYLYRAGASTPLAPAVACASCRPGAPADANGFVNVHVGASAAQQTSHLSRALSDDGRRVFFSSAAPLVPEDANGKVDAYEYDAPSGTVRLLSSGRDPADSWFLDASPSGDDAFFVTRERLVGWDVDGAYDLYDARVGGGFPEPPAPTPACDGDACRGQAHAPPPFASLGSATLVLPPAARPLARRRCRRGFVRRTVRGRVRCVRRARHRARRHGTRRHRR